MQRAYWRPLLAAALLSPLAGVAILGATAAGASTQPAPSTPTPTPILSLQLGNLSVNLTLPLDLGDLIQIRSPASTSPSGGTPSGGSPSGGGPSSSVNSSHGQSTPPRHASTSPHSNSGHAASTPTTIAVLQGYPPTLPSPATNHSAPATSGHSAHPTHSPRPAPRASSSNASIQVLQGDSPTPLLGLLIGLVLVTAIGVAVVVRISGHRGAREH